MTIGGKKRPPHTYTLGGHQLTRSEEEKDIGVTIDTKLNFENHIAEKVNKANRILGIITRTFEYKDKNTMLLLYKALVRPHLEYANQVWAPHTIKQRITLENVQRRFTRSIPGLKNLEYEDRLRQLHLPSLAYRRLRGDMIELYKIATGKYDSEVTEGLLKYSIHGSTRGHQYKLYKTRPRLDLRKYSFFQRTVAPWNSLPKEVVDAKTVQTFEARLDSFWRNHPVMYSYKTTEQHKPTHPACAPSISTNTEEELALEATQA
jgi:hypothetical protein